MKSKRGEYYTILILGDKKMGDDLRDCLSVVCTNKRTASEISGISYDKLVYNITRKGHNVLEYNNCVVIRSSTLYKGKQVGGLRNPKLMGYNRNR